MVRDVLSDAIDAGTPTCVLLGCTHFPLLADTIGKVLGQGVRIIDSARTTADEVARVLENHGIETQAADQHGSETLCVTDGAERFARTASRFLGREVATDRVTVIDLV